MQQFPVYLQMPLGLFSECSDLLPVYKWTYVIHRLNELNKKIEMPPQNLTAEMSEPKKKKKGEESGWEERLTQSIHFALFYATPKYFAPSSESVVPNANEFCYRK